MQKSFGKRFDHLDLKFSHHEFGTSKPDKNYNVYIEFDLEACFNSEKTNTRQSIAADRRTSVVDETSDIPAPLELIQCLVRDTPVMEYLLKAVQPIDGTGFAMVTMGFLSSKTATKVVR